MTVKRKAAKRADVDGRELTQCSGELDAGEGVAASDKFP